jgi:regulation of enolase protein 1 (concanavalin A-like superfamily)
VSKSTRFVRAVAILSILGNIPPTAAFAAANPPAFTRQQVGPGAAVTVGDFNSDGWMDIAGGKATNVVVRLAAADGTYRESVVIPGASNDRIIATAASDLNNDGRLDLLTLRWLSAPRRFEVAVSPGRGDGTFTAPRLIATGSNTTFLHTADFNSDGRQDVALGEEAESVRLLPGNGDFTFGTEIITTVGPWPTRAAVGDFNQDGKTDLAVVSRYGWRVSVLLNQGDGTFAVSDLPTMEWPWDIVATDLNGDGRADLAVVGSGDVNGYTVPPEGFLAVHLSTGSGTFGPAVTYATGRGARAVTADDFNGDGLKDIVTGNRSYFFDSGPNCGGWSGSDSISVFTGTGRGPLDPPVHFAAAEADENTASSLDSLVAANLNGDNRLDLLIGPETIFLGRAATANRPPLVFAWEWQQHYDGRIYLASDASDPDDDFLSYRWTDESGTVVGGPIDRACFEGPTSAGDYTYTVTVTDGHGASAAARVSVIVPEGSSPRVHFSNGENVDASRPYTVTWSASDVEGDISRFDVFVSTDGTTFQPIDGCTALPAAARQCVWQQPGPVGNVILRIIARDAAGHVGGAHMRASVSGGPQPPAAPWQHRDIGTVGQPGNATYSAGQYRVSGSGTDIWGTADAFHYLYQPLPYDGDLIVRVAAVSGSNAWTKAGVMIRESLTPASRHISMFVSPGKGVAYQRRLANGASTIHTTAATTGAPYWLKITRRDKYIRVFHSVDGQNWANNGSEVFENAGEMYIGLAVTGHDNTTLGTGVFDGVSLTIRPRNVPPSVRIISPPTGSTFADPADIMLIADASDSDTGVRVVQFMLEVAGGWSGIGMRESPPWSIVWRGVRTGTYRIRAVATDFADAQTVSEPVTVTVTDGMLEGEWSSQDIGAVGVAGRFADGDPITVEGSGADIWGAADAFHYAWREVSGDFQIVAQVAGIENVHAWTKAGLMIREHTGASSRHVSLFASAGRGVAFQRRLSEGGTSVHTDTGIGYPPIWLKLVRSGNTVYAYRSPNGIGWYLAGTQTLALPTSVKVGLAVTSHDNTTLATATFANVAVTPLTTWTSRDIGDVGAAGATSGFDPLAVEGSGADIWGTTDAFRFVYKTWTGDGEVIAKVASVENTHAWAKAGVMIRGGLETDASHVFLLVSPGKGIALQSRTSPGELTAHGSAGSSTAPYWVRLVRRGAVIAAYTSPDGAHWNSAGSRTIALAETAYVGLAVTSHAAGTLATATFESAEVRR